MNDAQLKAEYLRKYDVTKCKPGRADGLRRMEIKGKSRSPKGTSPKAVYPWKGN